MEIIMRLLFNYNSILLMSIACDISSHFSFTIFLFFLIVEHLVSLVFHMFWFGILFISIMFGFSLLCLA